jgi:heme/copper-type cytochrome/quinol oxidase subunit 2
MWYDFFEILYFAIPIAFVIFFIVSLCLFVCAKVKNKKKPGSVEESRVKLYKILLIISGIIVGVLAAVIISFIALLFLAVAYM